MNRKKILGVLLLLIAVLAGLFRFREIITNPPNLNTDEAAIGYNAYSILKTGRDEYGQFLPLAFRSFDDYKPPLYIYLTVPSVAFFGLNEFAVRFPSAFLGVMAVIITGFLAKKMFGNWIIGLLAAFLLAISPWHIQFTRTAYETGSNAFFTSLGIWLFLKGFEKRRWLILSGIVFGLQVYLYQASKVFVPLFASFLVLVYLYRKGWQQLPFFVLPFVLFLVPLVGQSLSPEGLLRFRGTSIFQDPKPVERREVYVHTDWLLNDNKSVRLFHSHFLTYFQDILVGYLSHFRPDFFLTSRSDSKIAYVPEVGLFPLWMAPFLLTGFYFLYRRNDKLPAFLLTFWVLVSPIPASVTTGLPSSIRTAVFLPSWQIIAGLGMWEVFYWLKRRFRQCYFYFVSGLILVVVYFVAFYVHMLLVHAPKVHARVWYASYKEFITKSLVLAQDYSRVVVSTGFDQPYIFYLFYSQYDPVKYLAEGGTKGGGFDEQRNRLGEKFYFRGINWYEDRLLSNTLLVATPKEVPFDEAKDHILARFDSVDKVPLAYFLWTHR